MICETQRTRKKNGLVEQVVPAGELLTTSEALAQRLANGAASVGVIKKAINQFMTMTLEGSLDYVSGQQYQMPKTEHHAEAVTA